MDLDNSYIISKFNELNFCLTQQKKYKYLLYFRSLKFCISLALATLSSFSLAARTPSKLGSRSLMRQLH